MSVWSAIGKAVKLPFKVVGKGIEFVGKGLKKGFGAVKKAVFGVGSALGATAAFLGLGRKAEAEGKESERGINQAASEGDRKVEGVKSETNKMASAPPPRPDAAAEQDKREARAEGEAAAGRVDAMEAGLRAMDKLSSHAAEIVRRYGSKAGKDMVGGMNMREPKLSASASANVLMQEQIRLLYEQKFNHKHGIFNVLTMIGASNELLGVLSDQLRLIHAQGITDANYDVVKAKVMERLAARAASDSVKANSVIDQNNEELKASIQELVALQKEGNEAQNSGTRPLLKKVGLGMVAGLAGLAGLVMASKYIGKSDEGKQDEDKDEKPEWKWPWEDDEQKERNDEEDLKNSDYIKDDGTLMSVEERNRVDEIKTEAKLSGGASAAATAIEGISAIKRGRAAASATKAAAEAAGKAGAKALTTEARKKFLQNLGPRAMKVVGAKIAAKLGIKAAAKGALKKVPVLGLLFSLCEAVPRIKNGDYKGAAIAIGGGAASLLHAADVVTGPGGSIAAISLGLAADGALALHDYNKAMEDLRTKGYSDLLDDDDLNDVFITPTEEEMSAADAAEKKVEAEKAEKSALMNASGGQASGDWGKVEDYASGGAQQPSAQSARKGQDEGKENKGWPDMLDKAVGAVGEKGGGSGTTGDAQKRSVGGMLKDAIKLSLKGAQALFMPGTLAGGSSMASLFGTGASSHEVSHVTSGTWMGYGAKDDYEEGMGDPSECRSYPPETMERITHFDAYPPNDIDESGAFNGDVQGMINDLVGMQGTIRYSMEERDIDKGVGDCSSFTKWALKKHFGIDIGGNCDLQLGENYGKVVDYSGVGINGEKGNARGPNLEALKPGDLIYYSSDKHEWNAGRPFRISHVEMYMGDGKVIGQTTLKGNGKGKSKNGPWVHDINDPVLGTYLAAKRYIGQTPETARYAADPQSVSAQQSPRQSPSQSSTPTRTGHEGKKFVDSFVSQTKTTLTSYKMDSGSASVRPPVHTSANATGTASGTASAQQQGQAPTGQAQAPTMIDNSTVTKGGPTYITNNNTTNIYTHEDGRGDSEVS